MSPESEALVCTWHRGIYWAVHWHHLSGSPPRGQACEATGVSTVGCGRRATTEPVLPAQPRGISGGCWLPSSQSTWETGGGSWPWPSGPCSSQV